MPSLHPQIEAVLKAQAAAGLRPIEALTPAEARAQMEETARSRKAEPLPGARVEERAIPGPGGPIRLRFYWPKEADAGNPVPAGPAPIPTGPASMATALAPVSPLSSP